MSTWTMKVERFHWKTWDMPRMWRASRRSGHMCHDSTSPGQRFCIGNLAIEWARERNFLTCSNALVNWGNPAATSHCASHSPSEIVDKNKDSRYKLQSNMIVNTVKWDSLQEKIHKSLNARGKASDSSSQLHDVCKGMVQSPIKRELKRLLTRALKRSSTNQSHGSVSAEKIACTCERFMKETELSVQWQRLISELSARIKISRGHEDV